MTRLIHLGCSLLLLLALCPACFHDDPMAFDVLERVPLKGSTEGGNAIPIRFSAPDLASTGLHSLTLRFVGAVTPTSPVFSEDVKQYFPTPLATLRVPITPKAQQEILLPVPGARFYALDFEWPQGEPALSAEGRSAEGRAIRLDLTLRGVLRFRLANAGLDFSSGQAVPHWLVVMDAAPLFTPEFLARLTTEADGSYRLDATHNAGLQGEAAQAVLAHFALYIDVNKDGLLTNEERNEANHLGQGTEVDVLKAGAPCDETTNLGGTCLRITNGSPKSGSPSFSYDSLVCDPVSHTLKVNGGLLTDVAYCRPYLCQDGWLSQLTESNGEACGLTSGQPTLAGYGCLAGGVCERLPTNACAADAALLDITPDSSQDTPIDFGVAQIGAHVVRSLVLHNSGTKVLTIFSLDWTADSAADFKSDTDGLSIPLAAGQTITIQPGANFPLAIGAYISGGGTGRAALRITSDSCAKNGQYVYLATSVFGSTTIDVAPPSIDYGATEVGKTESRSFFIKNVVSAACDPTLDPPPTKPCNKAIGVSNFKIEGADSGQFSIVSAVPTLGTDAPHYITPGTTYEVKVAFQPSRANDENNTVYDAYVRFVHDADINLPGLDKYEAIKVNLTGSGVVAKLCILPESLAFNQIPMSSATTQAVKITNCGGAPLMITNIEWAVDYSTPAGCVIQPESSVGAVLDATQFTFFKVVCTPPTMNSQAGFISVIWNTDQKTSIPVSYTVVAK